MLDEKRKLMEQVFTKNIALYNMFARDILRKFGLQDLAPDWVNDAIMDTWEKKTDAYFKDERHINNYVKTLLKSYVKNKLYNRNKKGDYTYYMKFNQEDLVRMGRVPCDNPIDSQITKSDLHDLYIYISDCRKSKYKEKMLDLLAGLITGTVQNKDLKIEPNMRAQLQRAWKDCKIWRMSDDYHKDEHEIWWNPDGTIQAYIENETEDYDPWND